LAASLGMGSALSLNTYILSIFAPYLIEEFGWSRSQWAMLGLVQMAVMVSIPIAGRLTDLYGVRRVAAVGAFSYPLFLLAIAGMNGSQGTAPPLGGKGGAAGGATSSTGARGLGAKDLGGNGGSGGGGVKGGAAGGGAGGISAGGGGGAGASFVDTSVTSWKISATHYNWQFIASLAGAGVILAW
ncbi:MAG: hypothetical protein J0I62_16530, partial [Microbacterium sp.]|nr:hypothetical protein [Microbacterium sp.]